MDDFEDSESPATSFTVLNQKLELDFSFSPRLIKGKATIEVQPHIANLKTVNFHCRQLKITSVKVEGRVSSRRDFGYSNLYEKLTLYPGTGIEQYHFPKSRIERHVSGIEDELSITIPGSIRIKEIRPDLSATHDVILNRDSFASGPHRSGEILFTPIKFEIEYYLQDFRDAVHFAGIEEGDSRYPHIYTRNSPFPGMASCLFPCIDDGTSKCTFEISIRYPRTLGDAFSKAALSVDSGTGPPLKIGVHKADSVMNDGGDDTPDFSEEEKAMEISVVCSGEMTDDIVDPTDSTRKTASFLCASPVLPQHIGIAIGPFENVNLSEYRDTLDDDRLGSNAIRVHAFCLPGRADEVRNSAMILARTLDNFTERYQSYPFEKAYKLAFVDDLDCDVASTASFSICSSRLLFPETVWEPLEKTTRVLVHAVASQWIGVNVIAERPNDHWVITGGSWFMTELYLRDLFGRNDHRFRQKSMVDKIMDMDHRRPSLHILGEYLALDPGEEEFMELKSLSVLTILHNRLVKQSGKNGVDRCLYRLLFNARNEKLANGAISTEGFLDICEKVGHQKLDNFFNQWVYGSGCPTFECFPQFNKKKQVIQLTIRQTQSDPTLKPEERPLAAADFMREVKENKTGLRTSQESPAFVGPMTIRIHEADGTPYEHIVEINSSTLKVEIPYNTKYKRLKRNRLAKERAAAAQGLETAVDSQDDVTLYSLGDLFNTTEEIEEWRISDWSPEDEARMEQESYEWLRVDADFEWICRAHINDMPSYMYVSQLQQDKDVVAQAESIQYLALKEGHPLISSILVKTLMDGRYFHGIRTMAAEVIAASAKEHLDWIGLFHLEKAFRELYCIPGSPMTRSNDFSDRASYLVQCAIPRAVSQIKGADGRAPMRVKRFLLDLIRYNDNRGNEYSDDYYVATLMSALADSLASGRKAQDPTLSLEDEAEEFEFTRKSIEEMSRHQRLDEWIPTYQNIYTTTALECGLKLMSRRVIPLTPTEFLQYTRIGNAENVRLKAWECLIALGMITKDSIIRFLVHEMSTDPSPSVRASLIRIFCNALGQLAIGDLPKFDLPAEPTNGDLVIERDEGPSDRAAEFARRTLDGACKGLKTDLEDNIALREALEAALRSQTTSLHDVRELVEVCGLLYPQINALRLTIPLPRYWRAEHIGNGQMRFYRTDKVRTTPREPLVMAPKEKESKGPRLKLPKLKPSAAPAVLVPDSQEVPVISEEQLQRSQSIHTIPEVPAPIVQTPAPVSAPLPLPVPTAAPAPEIPVLVAAPPEPPKPATSKPTEPERKPTLKIRNTAPDLGEKLPKPAPAKARKPVEEKPRKPVEEKPRKSHHPVEPKGRKSRIVVLKLSSSVLSRYLTDEFQSQRKRKAEDSTLDTRAPKRQQSEESDDMPLSIQAPELRKSTESTENGKKRKADGEMSEERAIKRQASSESMITGPERKRLVLKLNVGKGKLPPHM
ncbi:hypothetical protein CC78DRAFT_521139 [Lojkania enalia]|uniref:Transcription initiation factor TFIID subunit 2 n=1 Tax=Lojkania enalia TaxID=147567 RepID=A0A9P4K5E1_9PLEO|nr:hypothetical protein CC78DRAFT_521139 [Didymosphaeria enalia]